MAPEDLQSRIIKELQQKFGHIWLEEAAYPALLPTTTEEVMQAVIWSRQHGWKLLTVGRGHSFSSRYSVPNGVLTLVTLAREGVTNPDPRDLTVEVESGAAAKGVVEHVKAAGFRLDGWPDDYPGTVGGLICGEKGGTVRHLILGVDIVDGRGRSLRFGGRVRKNVSGFDIPGLFAGSRGRIGWLERVYLRLTPLQSPPLGLSNRRPRTSPSECQGLYERVTKALDPDGVFLKVFT